MDIVYSYPDVLSYSSFRHPTYSFSTNDSSTKQSKRDNRAKANNNRSSSDSCKNAKESCPICQERQRRPLATYIQQKSREDRTKDTSILEEEEAEPETKRDSTPNTHLGAKPQ